MRGFWTCQRQSGGVKCRATNPNRVQKCTRCGKRRPKRERPAHLSALSLSYEYYVLLNGGDHCGICGRERTPSDPKLHRDHEHKGVGTPRGLLCFPCNLQLKHTSTAKWLRAAADYLERVEARRSAA
jgi:hypothetical protein